MIKLFNDWAIDGDGIQFIVGKLKTKKDKKTGEMVEELTNQRYCSSLQHCIDNIAKAELTMAIHDYDMTFKEALECAEELAKKIDAAVKGENFPKED